MASFRIWVFVVCFATGGAGAAAAACRPADLAGTWDLYMTVGDDFFGAAWLACFFRMAPNGAILAGGRCLDHVANMASIGGRLALSPSCSASGQFNLRTGPRLTRVQVQSTLSREKSLLVGVAVADGSGTPSTFQAVKR